MNHEGHEEHEGKAARRSPDKRSASGTLRSKNSFPGCARNARLPGLQNLFQNFTKSTKKARRTRRKTVELIFCIHDFFVLSSCYSFSGFSSAFIRVHLRQKKICSLLFVFFVFFVVNRFSKIHAPPSRKFRKSKAHRRRRIFRGETGRPRSCPGAPPRRIPGRVRWSPQPPRPARRSCGRSRTIRRRPCLRASGSSATHFSRFQPICGRRRPGASAQPRHPAGDQPQAWGIAFFRRFEQKLQSQTNTEHRLTQPANDVNEAVRSQCVHRPRRRAHAGQDYARGLSNDIGIARQHALGAQPIQRLHHRPQIRPAGIDHRDGHEQFRRDLLERTNRKMNADREGAD